MPARWAARWIAAFSATLTRIWSCLSFPAMPAVSEPAQRVSIHCIDICGSPPSLCRGRRRGEGLTHGSLGNLTPRRVRAQSSGESGPPAAANRALDSLVPVGVGPSTPQPSWRSVMALSRITVTTRPIRPTRDPMLPRAHFILAFALGARLHRAGALGRPGFQGKSRAHREGLHPPLAGYAQGPRIRPTAPPRAVRWNC